MRKQKQIWENEYKTSATLPALSTDLSPSSATVFFNEFLQLKHIQPPQKMADIGSGAGRNALYFAKQGYTIFCMEYIHDAVKITKKRAEAEGLLEKIHTYETSIDKPWPFENDFFDLAIDCFSSIDIETKEGRETYRNELLRTLKPHGYALVSVVSTEDEWEKELLQTSPGSEKNSTLWPSGKFQKNYDEDELKAFYTDFKIVELQKISKIANKLGKKYTATNYWLIIQKL